MITTEKLCAYAVEDFTAVKFIEEAKTEDPHAPRVYLLERKMRVENGLSRYNENDESRNAKILRIIHRATIEAIALLSEEGDEACQRNS